MGDSGMFPCKKCDRRVYLYRGLCRECAPHLHAAHETVARAVERTMSEFERATGKSALSAWGEFEDFLDSEVRVTPEEAAAMDMLDVLEGANGDQD